MSVAPRRTKQRVSSLRARKHIIDTLGATLTLVEEDTGSLIVLDRAAGTVVTLPKNAKNGTHFKFVVGVTVTSNKDEIITGAAAELMVGAVLNCDTDSSDAVAIWKAMVGSSYISVNMDGSTQGGIKGDVIEVTKVNSTTWLVDGVTRGTSTVATPFSAS